MGMVNCFALNAYGVTSITAVDLTPIRIQWGRELGIPHVLDGNDPNVKDRILEITDGGADIVIVGPHTIDAMRMAFDVVGKGGTVLLYTPANPEEILPVNPSDLYFRDLTLTVSYSCDPLDTREALQVLLQKWIPTARLITHRFPFSQATEAFRTLAAGGAVLKPIVIGGDA